jgi:hypothetical protein
MLSKQIIAPGIIIYNIADEINSSFIEKIEDKIGMYLKPATIVDVENNVEALAQQYRSCYDHLLANMFLETDPEGDQAKLLKEIKDAADKYIEDFKQHYSVEKTIDTGGWIILKYGYQDKFDWHIDAGNRYPRNVSATLYFNDDYEGGLIEFKHFNISYKPKAGDLMVFASDYPYMHRVTPVTSGTRYAAVNWYRYASRPPQYDWV